MIKKITTPNNLNLLFLNLPLYERIAVILGVIFMSPFMTNTASKVAMQSLKGINHEVGQLQYEMTTGRKSNIAPATLAFSRVLETDVATYEKISDGLAQASTIVNIAMTATNEMVKVLKDMKSVVISGTNETADFGKINNELLAMNEQLAVIASTDWGGTSLVADNIGSGTTLSVPMYLQRSGQGAQATVETMEIQTLALQSGVFGTAGAMNQFFTSVTDVSSAQTALGEIETHFDLVVTGAAQLGTFANRIEDQSDFVSRVTDSIKSSIGVLVDADMDKVSARYQALQVKQDLGEQALSIANQSPQMLLSLFR